MLYDVFVVGSKDPSPVAQMHLAADLAKHFQAPVAGVAQAISSRNLRAGKALDEAQARVLSQQLASMGATTELRPTVPGPRTRVPTQTQVNRGTSTSEPSIPTLSTLASVPGTDLVGRDPFSSSTAIPAVPTLAAPHGHAPHTQSGPHTLGAATSVASRMSSTGARSPFAAPDETAPRLELARPTANRTTADTSDVIPRVRTSLPGSSGLDHMRLAADSTASGLEAVGETAKTHMLRCPKHGLYYDQRSASGCRKCLEPAKQMARRIERTALGFRLLALRDNPAKRAGWGLTLALVVGFLPAAWHAMAFGRSDVLNLRAQQAVLSQKVGTESVIAQYKTLDERVHESHSKHRRNSAVIWVIVASGAFAAWYRVT